jgi:hypothetical protein
MSVRSDRCLVSGCKGKLLPVYSHSELYTQLRFLQSLFDVTRARRAVEEENKTRERRSLAERTGKRERFILMNNGILT